MPTIQYPDVPTYAGVPTLTRNPLTGAVASVPILAVALGTLEGILLGSLTQAAQWGIFDSSGNRLGDSDTGQVLSVFGFEFTREMRVSDYPIESGSFASYNKVQTPATPVVLMTLTGTESDRATFLATLNAACIGTDLYNVVTPEATYVDYTIERYNMQRKAQQGATLLSVEIYLREIRQVSATYTQAAITAPQNATATAPVDNGKVQAQTPDTSTLKSVFNGLSL